MTAARSDNSIISSMSEEINKIASPSSLNWLIIRYTSPLAAASIPRVGSSKIKNFGFVVRERAITTFC